MTSTSETFWWWFSVCVLLREAVSRILLESGNIWNQGETIWPFLIVLLHLSCNYSNLRVPEVLQQTST